MAYYNQPPPPGDSFVVEMDPSLNETYVPPHRLANQVTNTNQPPLLPMSRPAVPPSRSRQPNPTTRHSPESPPLRVRDQSIPPPILTPYQPQRSSTPRGSLAVPITYQAPLPKLPVFTASDKNKPGEVTYEMWRYEVDCLLEGGILPPHVISTAIRQSLRGPAAMTAMHLGPQASVSELLKKLDDLYGAVETTTTLLQ